MLMQKTELIDLICKKNFLGLHKNLWDNIDITKMLKTLTHADPTLLC